MMREEGVGIGGKMRRAIGQLPYLPRTLALVWAALLPTSAMDPWAESAWLARFLTMVAGRTGILITHRFTTARYADNIYVMDQGRIVESGSHEELLALAGKYARAWKRMTSSE